ncbi:MAG: hypothetical protein SOZ63_03955, partial [Eggerthellaceae bacterium]|nr:hypothetical protein [Eggerthellaceae bacterium]
MTMNSFNPHSSDRHVCQCAEHINSISGRMEIDPLGNFSYPLDGEQLMAMNPYRPWSARITS